MVYGDPFATRPTTDCGYTAECMQTWLRVYTHPFLGEYDESKQLVLKSFHGHCEVDNGRLGADLRRVGRVPELRRQIHTKSGHDVQFLLADLHLVDGPGLDEVLLEQVVQCWVQLFAHVLDQKRTTHHQRILEMCAEMLVVEICYLSSVTSDASCLNKILRKRMDESSVGCFAEVAHKIKGES